jgi:sortase (surface protein transpeptidase)
VGIDRNDQMAVPTNARDVAWLYQGPLPGRTNNIVLAGHIDFSGALGSFGNIQRLRPGDTVALSFGNKVWAFQIKWSCLFDRNTSAADQIMGYTDTPSITLISCGGVFDPSVGTHDKRVAVRGELIKSV